MAEASGSVAFPDRFPRNNEGAPLDTREKADALGEEVFPGREAARRGDVVVSDAVMEGDKYRDREGVAFAGLDGASKPRTEPSVRAAADTGEPRSDGFPGITHRRLWSLTDAMAAGLLPEIEGDGPWSRGQGEFPGDLGGESEDPIVRRKDELAKIMKTNIDRYYRERNPNGEILADEAMELRRRKIKPYEEWWT